jgi:hypothetical protein
MVTAAHSQQYPGIVRKAVGESVNPVSRETDSKKTARDFRIVHDTLDLIQTTPWNFGIDMDKPKDVAMCSTCSGIHLYGPVTSAYNKLITKIPGKVNSAIGTSTIRDNNLCARRSLAQTRKTLPQQQRLVQDWNNN